MSQKRQQPSPKGGTKDLSRAPLSEEEIKGAIEASGYPLEVVVWKEFLEAKFNADLGVRMQVREASTGTFTADVDVVASLSLSVARAADGEEEAATRTSQVRWIKSLGRVEVGALVQCKKLHKPRRFAGIVPVTQPSPSQQRAYRARIGGVPHFGVFDEQPVSYGKFFLQSSEFGAALDVLQSPVVCVHSALVSRDGKHNPKADRDHGVWSDLETLALAEDHAARELTLTILEAKDTVALPAMRLLVPVLVLDTPTLVVYNPLATSLSQFDRFTLRHASEIRGKAASRYIEVTTLAALPSLIEQLRKVAEGMAAELDTALEGYEMIGQTIRQRWREERG
jgi:hypothetical protein